MIANDRKEKERSEAKNSVEEYVYEMREKLSNEYERFSTEENSATFLKMLDETENWLYSEEAENQEKSVYVDRLQKLKVSQGHFSLFVCLFCKMAILFNLINNNNKK